MQPTLTRRLKLLEEQAPEPSPVSELAQLFRWMTQNELDRMDGILERAEADGAVIRPRDQQDFERLTLAAWQRRETGERPSSDEVHACPLVLALQGRHAGFPPNTKCRFDLLDVTQQEVELLAQLAKTATFHADLEAAADIISRLRFDAEPMNTGLFAGMVLDSHIPLAPRIERTTPRIIPDDQIDP